MGDDDVILLKKDRQRLFFLRQFKNVFPAVSSSRECLSVSRASEMMNKVVHAASQTTGCDLHLLHLLHRSTTLDQNKEPRGFKGLLPASQRPFSSSDFWFELLTCSSLCSRSDFIIYNSDFVALVQMLKEQFVVLLMSRERFLLADFFLSEQTK